MEFFFCFLSLSSNSPVPRGLWCFDFVVVVVIIDVVNSENLSFFNNQKKSQSVSQSLGRLVGWYRKYRVVIFVGGSKHLWIDIILLGFFSGCPGIDFRFLIFSSSSFSLIGRCLREQDVSRCSSSALLWSLLLLLLFSFDFVLVVLVPVTLDHNYNREFCSIVVRRLLQTPHSHTHTQTSF